MLDEDDIRSIVDMAQRRAAEAVETRNRALRQRAARLEKTRREVAALDLATIDAKALSALAAEPEQTLVAEGDSWFDYPGKDVLSVLEDQHGYLVEAVAHRGDRIEEMAYMDGQLVDFTALLDKLLGGKVGGRTIEPRAILLSGGGNDVAGEDLRVMLDHASSPEPGLNDLLLQAIIDRRLATAYTAVIVGVTEVCMQRLKRPLPIIVHGYDYAVPDGRGFLGGGFGFPGPWLEPGLRLKGFKDRAKGAAIVASLIDRFNTMLQRLVQTKGLSTSTTSTFAERSGATPTTRRTGRTSCIRPTADSKSSRTASPS